MAEDRLTMEEWLTVEKALRNPLSGESWLDTAIRNGYGHLSFALFAQADIERKEAEWRRILQPARHDALIDRVRDVAEQIRDHQHPAGPNGEPRTDLFCLNLTSWVGDHVQGILEHIDALEMEKHNVAREIQRSIDTEQPPEPKQLKAWVAALRYDN